MRCFIEATLGQSLGPGAPREVGFTEKTRCVNRGAEIRRILDAKALRQAATQQATGCVGGYRIVQGLYMMMMTFITQGGEGRGEKIRRGKLRKAKAEALKRGLVARSCARSGRKDVVGEVKGIEMMGVLIAGRGARERGSRRLQVEVHSKR